MKFSSWKRRDEEEGEQEDEEKENEQDEEEDENKPPPSPTQIAVKAVVLLVIGTAGCAVFSDPLVDAVSNFSKVVTLIHHHTPRWLMTCAVQPPAYRSRVLKNMALQA